MFLYSFCSSSKGNATYIGDKKSGIIIDAGVGVRQLVADLSALGVADNAVSGIFITHEHSDHIKGLKPILKRLNGGYHGKTPPVYGTLKTLCELHNAEVIPFDSGVPIDEGDSVICGDMTIRPFNTPHDSTHSVGYVVNTKDDKKITVCTDLGHITPAIYDNLAGSDLCMLESNYDPAMLEVGGYPYFLKRRIKSDHGHLSNEDCANVLARLIQDGCHNFLLSHLSENNNNPSIAYLCAVNALQEVGAKVNSDYTLNVSAVRNVNQNRLAI